MSHQAIKQLNDAQSKLMLTESTYTITMDVNREKNIMTSVESCIILLKVKKKRRR